MHARPSPSPSRSRYRHELEAQSEGLYRYGSELREHLIELQGNVRVLCRVRPFIPGEGSPDLAAFSLTRAEMPHLRELARMTRAEQAAAFATAATAAAAAAAESADGASADDAAPSTPPGGQRQRASPLGSSAVYGARAVQSPPPPSRAEAAEDAPAASFTAAIEAARNRIASLQDGVRCFNDPARVEVAAPLPQSKRERGAGGAKTPSGRSSGGGGVGGGAKRNPPQRERVARKFAFSHVVSGDASQADVYKRAKGIALSVRTCKHNVIIFAYGGTGR